MKKKGFTLVELLSVIAILAVIALIATPIVLNILSQIEKGTFRRTAEGILNSSEVYYMRNQSSGFSGTITFKCDMTVDKCISNRTDSSGKKLVLNTTGKLLNGDVNIDEDGNISFELTNDTYCAYKNALEDKITVVDGNCESISIS